MSDKDKDWAWRWARKYWTDNMGGMMHDLWDDGYEREAIDTLARELRETLVPK